MKQPITRFFLDKRLNKNGTKRIYVDIHYGYSEIDYKKTRKNFNSDRKDYKRVVVYTQCKIKPENFGKTIIKGSRKVFAFDQKIFDKYSRTNRAIKTKLEQTKNAVTEVANQFYIKRTNPTPEEFKESLLIELGRNNGDVVKEKTVLEFLYDKIANDRENAEKGKKGALSPNHIKTYVSLSRMFENYQIAVEKEILFSDFNNKKFQWQFFEVVDSIYRGEIEVNNPNQKRKQATDPTGYGAKSINKYIKLLHRVLRLGKRDGFNMTLDLDDPNLMLENPPPQKEIYLNEQELEKIINTKVSDDKLLNAKQFLIIGSLMGLRVEDMTTLHKLKPKQYSKNGQSFTGVEIYVNKTDKDVVIPLLKPVRDVLEQNDNRFPVFRESVNRHLKTFCELAGIDSIEERTKISFRDGKLETLKLPKYKLVSTHDCRRTFITNLGLKGVGKDIVESMSHPKKKNSNDMMAVYNNADMVDKAVVFLNAIEKIESSVYC